MVREKRVTIYEVEFALAWVREAEHQVVNILSSIKTK